MAGARTACVASGLTGVLWSALSQSLPHVVIAISLFVSGLNVAVGLAVRGICALKRCDTAGLIQSCRFFKHQFNQQPTGFAPMDGEGAGH